MNLTAVDTSVGTVACATDSESGSDSAGHSPNPRPRSRASADGASVKAPVTSVGRRQVSRSRCCAGCRPEHPSGARRLLWATGARHPARVSVP